MNNSDQNNVEGSFTTYYTNGQTQQKGTYINGKLSGRLTTWYENGQIHENCTFKNDQPDGKQSSWYKNGQICDQYKIKNDHYVGKFRSWYENGNKASECCFQNGKRYNDWTMWYENGQKKEEANKQMDYWKTWDKYGREITNADYQSGISHYKNIDDIFEEAYGGWQPSQATFIEDPSFWIRERIHDYHCEVKDLKEMCEWGGFDLRKYNDKIFRTVCYLERWGLARYLCSLCKDYQLMGTIWSILKPDSPCLPDSNKEVEIIV